MNNRYRDSDNKRSQAVVYTKRVNGNYYVVEAVPDSKAKTLQIISAYKTKAEGVSQVLNMPESSQLTSETPHAFAPSDNNVSQTKSYVKSVPATVDGRSVTVSGIDRIETSGNRAQMYVKTADGESVALSDVNFGNRETEAIYNFAQGFESTNTARAFVTGYNQGDSANDYMNAFLDFRSAGMAGRDFDSVLQSTANKYGKFEVSQLRQAYYAGVNEENNAPKRYSKKAEERAEKKGGLLRNYKSKLTREQAGQVYVMEALAKKYGFVIEMRDTLADGMANGYYDPKSDRIYIALDAKDGGYLHAGGHELYHYIERWSPEAATKLREFVINRLKTSKDYDYKGRVKELEKLYEGYGQEDIDSEIVAECMFDVFDEQTIKELVGENRSLAVKIQSWIQGFIESINEILKNLGLTSPEIKALEGDEEALETISGLFKSALEQTRENKASGKADVTESENTVKYSINPEFERRYDEWDKKGTGGYFFLGTTSEPLQSIGINPAEIYWDKTKIIKIKKDHPTMTDSIIKQVPNLLENPVMVTQSLTVTNRVVVFGELYDENGHPVVTALELRPDGRIENFVKVTSAYPKKALQNLINESDILYVDPNKKRTDTWFQALRLQLPAGVTKYGSIGMVTYVEKDVNGKISFDNKKTAKTAVQIAFEKAQQKATNNSISEKAQDDAKKFSLKSDRYDYSKTFAQQIEDYKNGKLPQYDTLIVGPTPEVLQNVGLNALPMTYGTGHLKDVLSGGKTDHDFGETLLKQLPEAIKKPVAVISSKSHGNTSLVAILDMQYKGKSIISSVVIDGYGRQNNETIDSNAITSMHTRKNAITSLLKDAVNGEAAGNTSVYYIDAKKAAGLLQTAGLQLPSDLFRTDGYIHSIRNSDSNVKPKIENVTKSRQFKRTCIF